MTSAAHAATSTGRWWWRSVQAATNWPTRSCCGPRMPAPRHRPRSCGPPRARDRSSAEAGGSATGRRPRPARPAGPPRCPRSAPADGPSRSCSSTASGGFAPCFRAAGGTRSPARSTPRPRRRARATTGSHSRVTTSAATGPTSPTWRWWPSTAGRCRGCGSRESSRCPLRWPARMGRSRPSRSPAAPGRRASGAGFPRAIASSWRTSARPSASRAPGTSTPRPAC